MNGQNEHQSSLWR